MIALCTGKPAAALDGDRVTARIPSGASTIEIALTPHEAMSLAGALSHAALGKIEAARGAEVVAFEKREARHG